MMKPIAWDGVCASEDALGDKVPGVEGRNVAMEVARGKKGGVDVASEAFDEGNKRKAKLGDCFGEH